MRPFRHYIIEKDGRSLYVNNGVVSSTNNRVPIPRGPSGFTDFSLTWERDLLDTIGVVKNVSVPLGYIEDGYDILCDQFYKSNVDRELFYTVTMHTLETTATTFRHRYKQLYKGQFDFTTWDDDGTQVKIKVNEGGNSRKLKANKSTVYEIRIDEEDYDILKQDGILLHLKQNYLIPGGIAQVGIIGDNGVHMVGAVTTTKEGEASGFGAFDVYFDKSEPSTYTDDLRYFAVTTQEIEDVRIKGSVKINPFFAGHVYKLELISSLGPKYELVNQSLTSNDEQELPFDLTFDTQANEKFFLVGTYSIDNAITTTIVYVESTFSIEFDSRYPTTYVKVLKPSVVFKKLLKLMGISEDYCDTSFVETFDDYVLCSGDANRGLEDAVFKTSFSKFFQFCKVVMGAGQGIVQDVVSILVYDDFFKTTNPIPIPRIKNLKVKDATDLRFNTVKIGWAEEQIDDVNGKYSFNNSHVYGLPTDAVNKQLDLVSEYIADPYVIELHRLNLEGKTTTDNEKDNKIFVLDTTLNTIRFSGNALIDTADEPYVSFSGNEDRIDLFQPGTKFTVLNSTSNNTTLTVVSTEPITGGFNVYVKESVTAEAAINITFEVKYRTLRRESYDTIEGIPETAKGSIFNVNLNPAILIRRHIKWINSVCYNYSGYIKFISTEKNRNLRYTKGSTTFDQDADMAIGTERLFLPLEIDIDTEEPADLINEMDEDPNRAFEMGDSVSGFLRKVAIQPGQEQEQAYKLLLSPSVDILNIHRNAYK